MGTSKKKTAAKKKASVKKAVSKAVKKSKSKGATKNSNKKKVSAKDLQPELLKELKKIIKDLDEDSIRFLLQQANALQYNMRVEELSKHRKKIDISDQMRNKKARLKKNEVHVKEGDDGTYFMVTINNYRNFFARDEMKKLVKICHASVDEKDASTRLYNWFYKERRDIVKNSAIEGSRDSALAAVYKFMISNYTVKK